MNNNYTSPVDVAYFYGRMLREEVNRILEQKRLKDGLFLLRELVSEAGSYALSICFNGSIHHYKIERQEDGKVKIDKGRKFIGPIELIKHHQEELDGLITKPIYPCNRENNIQPVFYLFINDAEFYKLVEDQIVLEINKLNSKKILNDQQYIQELNDARRQYRYKYERIVLKSLHFKQHWFKPNIERDEANQLLLKSGLQDGKFLVRSNSDINNPLTDEYKISLCFSNEIKHYKIKTNHYGNSNEEIVKYCLEGGLEFDSITQLVDYYHRCSDGLACSLRTPFLPPSKISPVLLDSLSNKTNNPNTSNNKPNNSQKNINNLLNNGEIYNSNLNYNLLMNNENNENNRNQILFNNNHQNSNGKNNYKNSGETSSGGGSSNGNNGVTYVDDEPANPNDVTNLKNVPEIKRPLFENEENYEYDSLPNHTIDIKDLVFYDKLGSGCFGSVHRGALASNRYRQETPVAIKQLNLDTEESKEEITKEADLMKSLNNQFVIKFIGMCFQKNGTLMIVLELAKLGPLHKYLRTHKEMSMIKIIKLCYQVAIAMQYLSSKNLVHRDLAARNVLLVSEDLAKVSDFGMSRKMGENKYYETHSQGKWPLKWYPPDAIQTGKFDEKSDVWSYGVTCWEATSYGGRPYQGIDIACLLVKLENGDRLNKPANCPTEIYNIMIKCWHNMKANRPTFRELVKDLKQTIKDLYQIDLEYRNV